VSESKQRLSIRFDFPPKITVNLAPADLPKDGAAYDLPIAVGVLIASGQFVAPPDLSFGKMFFTGTIFDEASADRDFASGSFCKPHTRGNNFCPAPSAAEAQVVSEITVIPVKNLADLFRHLTGTRTISPLIHTGMER
jgi:magnesium chelatase family protein